MNRADFVFSFAELRAYIHQSHPHLLLDHELSEGVNHSFRLLIPKYYLDLIDWSNVDDPLRKMVVTSNVEQETKPYELEDPIADKTNTPVPGIIHRHTDRCLLMLTNFCAINCRFCFRKNLLSTHTADKERALTYIEEHKEIEEVIFSGGDPFMLSDHFLTQAIDRLSSIKHIKIIRFHTRVPAVYPKRLTHAFINVLKGVKKQLVVVIHINHVREVTPEFVRCVQRIRKAGALVLSQTVLLKGVNNRVEDLSNLFRSLIEVGVKPYYLHHLDLAQGTHHFRVSIREGKKLMQELRTKISGIAVPEYVLDLPGGYGKVPVSWLQHIKENKYEAPTFFGGTVVYEDPLINN